MDLRQLRYFLTVAEERRFAPAARRLHLAAPSLSQQIRALERDLHVTLFDRTPGGVVLTPAGRMLADRARVILAEADRARDDVRSAGAAAREQVALRVCTMADPVLDGPLRAVGLAVEGIEVFVTSCPGDDAVEAVRQGRADVAIVWSRPHEHRDLEGVVLGAVQFGAVVPLTHPLADLVEIPVGALAHERVVMFPRAGFPGVWQQTVDHLLPAGPEEGQVVVEPDLLNSPEAMVRAVGGGAGVAPGIVGVADHMGVTGVVVRPLDPPLFLDLELVWRGAPRTPVRRLIDFLVAAVGLPAVLIAAPGGAPARGPEPVGAP